MGASVEKVKNKNHLPSTRKSRSGKTNRTKGHNFERKIAADLRGLGFERCLTSRQASRLYDDCKLDFFGLPFNLQAKNVSSRGLDYMQVLASMKELVDKHLPDRSEYPFAVIHKKGRVELAVLTLEDFYKLLSYYIQLNGNSSHN